MNTKERLIAYKAEKFEKDKFESTVLYFELVGNLQSLCKFLIEFSWEESCKQAFQPPVSP